MSDTDDGFDEEAVRRELREKYENEDRGETERMSELLLQGATMTNQHCDNCGTPIFRYDGQSFCPNCQHEYEQAQADQQAQSQQHAGDQQDQSQSQTASQRGDQQPASGQTADRSQPPAVDAEATTSDATAPAADATAPAADATESTTAATAPTTDDTAPTADTGDRNRRPRDQAPETTQSEQGGRPTATPAVSGEGADALESSIAALARRAAGSDDPRRAREYLEAAREAAEALAALRRNE